MKHEKELSEEAIRHKTAAADTLMDTTTTTTTVSIEEGSIDPTTTTTSTTVPIDVTTTTDNTKKSLQNPIDFNHKVGFITIKFDDPGPPLCPTRDEGKSNGGTEGTVVVEEGEGEGVSLPQVVLSENNGHYILRLPTDFTPAMTDSDGECHLNPHTHHHQDKVMKDSHHTTTTHHHASPHHHHLHTTSQH